jgi:hypothetical protein
MVEKFEDWGDYEIGKIAKAFMDCGNRSSCADCPCSYVLCGVENINESREAFVREFARRVMA